MTLNDRRWVSDIRGALIADVLLKYLHLWELLSSVELQPEVEDTHIFGSSLLLASTPQNRLMKLYLLGLLISILWKEF
jgi:hypothetical protein